MSYRNPKIIDDKSGLIVSQAIDKATATIGQSIVAFGAEEKRREGIRKEEQERRDQIFITLANDMAKNSNLFNANISKASAGLRNVLIPRNEKLLQRINDIQIQQRINGNKDPELSKELSNLRTQVADGNAMAQTYIEAASNLSTDMKDPGAFLRGEKTFRNGTDNTSDESAFIYFATGGRPGYTTTWDNDLNVTVSNGEKTYTNTREEFEAKSKNLYITSKGNMRQDENENINKEMYSKTGDLRTDLKFGEAKIGDEIKEGRIYTYSNQPLRTQEVERIISLSAETVGSKLGSLDGDTQAQAIRLNELNINIDEYQNGTAEKKIELIKQFAKTNFLDTKGVEYDEKEGSYSIKGQIGNSTKVKGPNATQILEAEWNKVTTQNFNAFDANDVRLTGKSLADAIINSLPQNRINAGEDGEIKVEANDDGNIVVYTGKVDKVKTQKALDIAYTKFKEEGGTGVAQQPGVVYEKQIYDITTGTTAQRISRLSKYFMTFQKVGYATAEAKAREFLNAPLK